MAEDIRKALDRIVLELHNLVEARVQEAIEEALKNVRVQSMLDIVGDMPTGAIPKKGARKAAPSPKASPTGKRVRRTQEDIESIGGQILAALKKEPGLSSEGIQRATGLAKADIQRPLENLRESKQVRTKGERRGMQYFAR